MQKRFDPVSLQEEEFPVPDGVVLVSRSNLKGIITYCNEAFCCVSGYSEVELLGSPHSLIRHPDVPPELFAECWKTIKAGGNWRGILKNRRKDGGFYWVEAHISPWVEEGAIVGYISMRHRASPSQVENAQHAYREVCAGRISARDAFVVEDGRYVSLLQQRLATKMIELEGYHRRHEHEKQVGSHIMDRLTQMPESLQSMVRRYSKPADHLNGDALIAAMTPTDMIYVMLADAVGHGLAAAINVLPLCRTFNAMAHKGFSLRKIAEELNNLVRDVMPRERFVATMLVAIDPHTRVYEVWNAGCPTPLLVSASGNVLHEWPSLHLPLGLIGGENFNSKPEVFRCEEESAQMILFSDGLIEATKSDGVMFGEDEVRRLLSEHQPDHRFDALIAGLERHMAGEPAHDDISMAVIGVDLSEQHEFLACSYQPGRAASKDNDWKFAVTFEASELKYVDVVPMLMQNICNIHAAQEHESALFLILSELFNNALDHGILQLDSAMKCGPDGFEGYFELRDKRLKALSKGKVTIELERVTVGGMQAIRICIVDSGNGFDVKRLAFPDSCRAEMVQHGRGIALVRSMTHKLDYLGKGNKVVAYYITDGKPAQS